MTNFSSLASAAGLSGTQYKLRYEQSSCRLELTGLPDVTATASADQPQQQLNILTGWDLNLGQKASLQGKREHLQALVSAVQPYVRLLVSAQPCQQSGGSEAVVSLEPQDDGRHLLRLRSSQPDTPPLELALDHAELADLNHCIDQMLVDARCALGLEVQSPQPLRRGQYRRSSVRRQGQWIAPAAACASVVIVGALVSLLPLPQHTAEPTGNTTTTEQSKP